MAKVLDPDVITKIKRLYSEGYTYDHIADLCEVSRCTVVKYVKPEKSYRDRVVKVKDLERVKVHGEKRWSYR